MAVLDRATDKSQADFLSGELRGVLDAEIAALPEAYRRPVLLCYLQGKTNEEAARLLGCPKGTVMSRLARATEQLRRRLTRRGWALSSAALATMLTDKALAAPLPAGLVASTLAYVSGKPVTTGALAAKVVALSDGVLRMMWLNKLKLAAGVILAVVLAGTGIGLVVRQTWAGGDEGQGGEPAARAQKATPKTPAQESVKAEIEGLRKEVAGLREEIKALRRELVPGALAQEKGPTYQGKPLSFWLHQFKDEDPAFRIQAVEALGYFARKNKQLIPTLVSALGDDGTTALGGGTVAWQAIQSLSAMGDGAVPLLMEVVKTKPSRTARRNALYALAQLGPKAKAAVPLLVGIRHGCLTAYIGR